MVRGSSAPPPLCLSEEMGIEEWPYPGDTAGCQQGWLRKPALLHLHCPVLVCVALCEVVAQPQVIEGFSRRHKVLGVCLWGSYLQVSEQSSFHISNPLQREPLGCAQECIIELPQRLHPDYLISWFIKRYFLFPYQLNWTKKKQEKITLVTVPKYYRHLQVYLQRTALRAGKLRQ